MDYFEYNRGPKRDLPDNVIEFRPSTRKIEISESTVVEHVVLTDEEMIEIFGDEYKPEDDWTPPEAA